MGITLIDAGALIGFLDNSDSRHRGAKKELENAEHRGDQISIPASAFAASLASREGESSISTVREFVERLPPLTVGLDLEIALVAAQLRASHGQKLKLPDAIVVATAIHREADALVTTDRGWPAKGKLGYRGDLIRI